MSSYTTILTETHDRVGLIRLNRPKALNALNNTLIKELMDALATFDADPAIGAVVLTGNERAFAAGADIKEMMDETPVSILRKDHIAPFDRILQIKKPVIAAVSGWCLGGGNELAMSCDMIVASESAKFGQPEINLGVIPGAGGTQRLTRAVGKAIAMEMVLNNRTLSAQEAAQFGLVNRIVPVERYLEEALALANEIAARAPLAVQLGKEAVNHAFESFLADGLKDERRAFYYLFASEDQKEGMRAFADKRPAQWKGE
ncbi:MAG TPA: enoyl-CoA hydratase-related protein [Anaerolineales bacterium]|nr:enoyl-CoA hydratase-related protein [Anaerolineales bacterium]